MVRRPRESVYLHIQFRDVSRARRVGKTGASPRGTLFVSKLSLNFRGGIIKMMDTREHGGSPLPKTTRVYMYYKDISLVSYEKSGPGNLDRFIPRKTRGPLGAIFCEKYSAASNSAGSSGNSGVHRELHAASLFHNGGRGRRHGKRERHFHIFPRINIALRRAEPKSRTRRRPAAKSRARRHEILMRARLHQTGL